MWQSKPFHSYEIVLVKFVTIRETGDGRGAARSDPAPDISKGALMTCRVNGVPSHALLDTGAEATIISDDVFFLHWPCWFNFFFSISNNFNYKAQLTHTLLAIQVTLRYSQNNTCKTILTLLAIRVTYEGNTILNTVLTESTITFITGYFRYAILYLHYLLNIQLLTIRYTKYFSYSTMLQLQ